MTRPTAASFRTFDCGSEAQTTWLRRHALVAQQADTARVYVVRPHGERREAGYYALAAGSIEPELGSARLAAGAGRHPIPVVILARLGVDIRDQGHGLGRQLVRNAFMQTAAVAERIGARALLIHVETTEAAGFYRRLDPAFEPSTADPLLVIVLHEVNLRGCPALGVDATDGPGAVDAESGDCASETRSLTLTQNA